MLRQALPAVGTADVLPERHSSYLDEQLGNALARAGTSPYDGDAEAAGEPLEVDLDLITACLVEEVHAEDDLIGDLQHLQQEVHVALQAGGVSDDDRDVGAVEEDEVAGDLLILARRGEGISTWEVYNLVALASVVEGALSLADRLARPVPRMLLEPREGIEDGALPRIGVPR